AAGAPRPAGAIGLAGSYDLSLRNPLLSVFAPLTGAGASHPIAFADRPGPPLLLLHGALDAVVFPIQSERLAARRRAAGHDIRLAVHPALGHFTLLGGLSPGRAGTSPVMEDIARFVASLAGAAPSLGT
ncbi:MAG TPA: prolyl oligopeptidase family serine peptidase, partial [Acetobacteraceae bacterium]|nr:prolyl oligopeptidase family serine peptidase [Acetobacteraceae bacterium]